MFEAESGIMHKKQTTVRTPGKKSIEAYHPYTGLSSDGCHRTGGHLSEKEGVSVNFQKIGQ
jgi:hypothetical protein